MIKSFLASFSIMLAVLMVPVVIMLSAQVSAVDVFPVCENGAAATDVCQNVRNPSADTTNPVIRILRDVINIVSFIVGAASIIMIILAGLSFITANGDAQSIAKGRRSIIYALVGIVIVVFAQTLVAFVLNKL